jgi:hypothetical protein
MEGRIQGNLAMESLGEKFYRYSPGLHLFGKSERRKKSQAYLQFLEMIEINPERRPWYGPFPFSR